MPDKKAEGIKNRIFFFATIKSIFTKILAGKQLQYKLV